MRTYLLRLVHGLFALYFILCIIYIYYAAVTAKFDILLAIAIVSLGFEGLIVFILNKGDCPLIHIQKRIGDEVPFFELFFPKHIAKKAIPFFSTLTWFGLAILIIRFILEYIF